MIPLKIPLNWVGDGVTDCQGGEDEREGLWKRCGDGRTSRVVTNITLCQDVFVCLFGGAPYIAEDQMCDGRDTCHRENQICGWQPRQSPVTRGNAIIMGFCQPGLENLQRFMGGCTTKAGLQTEGTTFGLESETMVTLPKLQQSCRNLYGYAFLIAACLEGCIDASCPLDLTTPIPHNSCVGKFWNRVKTIHDSGQLTFVLPNRGHFTQEVFPCGDGDCVPYDAVCDLVSDCKIGSDEKGCENNFECLDGKRFVAITAVCDGQFDCGDMSDECNERCGVELLESKVLKVFALLFGTVATILNSMSIRKNLIKLCKIKSMIGFENTILICVISLGDFITGIYLLILSLYDQFMFGDSFCSLHMSWLSGKMCTALGVLNTMATEISILAMTVLSVTRAMRVCEGLRETRDVNLKRILKSLVIITFILTSSVLIAVVPIIQVLDETFVNGKVWDSTIRFFTGVVSKREHMRVIEGYYGRVHGTSEDLSWGTLVTLIQGMFTNQYSDWSAMSATVGFYGNAGVCMFKYLVTTSDPQMPLAALLMCINLACMAVIAGCYIAIRLQSRRSLAQLQVRATNGPNSTGGVHLEKLVKRQQRIDRKVTLIIATNFLSWVPFCVICCLHLGEVVDATPTYGYISVIVLPVNSVLNPLIYSDLWKRGRLVIRKLWGRVCAGLPHRKDKERVG
eukprot:sb/3462692/